MELSPEGIIGYTIEYTRSLPSEIMEGDIFAITIALIAFFIAVIIINQLTSLLIRFLKRAILLIIVSLAFTQFFIMLSSRVMTEGWTADTIIFGAIGIIIGIGAVITALLVALGEFHEARKKPFHPPKSRAGAGEERPKFNPYTGERLSEEPPEVPAAIPPNPSCEQAGATTAPLPDGTVSGMKEGFSINSIKHDRSLGTVLAYLIVAQFGVYSSFSIPAPSFQVGLMFFLLFIVAGLIFIHFTYHNYITGLRHLFVGLVVGGVIAILLGYFWGNIPLAELLSPAFFQSNALVALVTGLALSLFMGGKG